MKQDANRTSTVEGYIIQFPEEVQSILCKIRSLIQDEAPGAEERISYQIPGYYLNGMLVWFGAHKNHIGFYPTGSGIEAFHDELKGYKFSKGAVQFPLNQPIPYDLIRKIVKYRVEENKRKMKGN